MQESLSRRVWLVVAALSGLATVSLGAWSAHGLAGRVTSEGMAWIEVGLTYQMPHVAGLLAVSLLPRESFWRHLAGGGFALGTLLFSGGLYAQALMTIDLGAIIPVGGLCYMVGWVGLLVYALTGKERANG
jgi:uncharacterized membrane protein YgdD (TMEM256/DUF423 family)